MVNTQMSTPTYPTVQRTPWTLLGGLVRLSKITVYQHYFGLILAWLLLTPQALDRPHAVPAMVLFLIAQIGIVTCACSADDVVGYRNGSDAANYRPGDLGRDIRRKPLLSGAVTERQAVIFVICAGATAVLGGLAAFTVLGWDVPWEAVAIFAFAFVFTVQYSAGLRFSYFRGGTEVLLLLATAAGLLFPFLALEQRWTAPAVIMSLLLGLWLVMVSTYSNVNDIEGDRAVGRQTLAVATPPTVFKSAMVLFFLSSVGLTFALTFGTEYPWWTLLTMTPVIVLHALELYYGPAKEQWLKARKFGFIAYDVGFLGLLIPTLFVR